MLDRSYSRGAPAPPPPTPNRVGVLRVCRSSLYPHCGAEHEVRVETIIDNLTASEMVSIINKGGVERLGIGAYKMWADGSFVNFRSGGHFSDRLHLMPTCQHSGACSTDLWVAIGHAMSTEARYGTWELQTTFPSGATSHYSTRPRWGRNSNSPSRDPLLRWYGPAIVTGTQTPSAGVNLVNSEMKHWTGYGVENGGWVSTVTSCA